MILGVAVAQKIITHTMIIYYRPRGIVHALSAVTLAVTRLATYLIKRVTPLFPWGKASGICSKPLFCIRAMSAKDRMGLS